MTGRLAREGLGWVVAVGMLASGGVAIGEPVPLKIGVMTHFAQGWDTDLVDRLEAGGIGHVRDELYWDEVEREAGVIQFPEKYGVYMERLEAGAIEPLIALTFANRNYDGGQTPHSSEGIGGYARYAAAVVERFPQIRAVEVWNEYNGSFCEGPATDDRPATYARMLAAATAAVRAVRADVVVAGGATVGVPLPYWRRLFELGALEHLDVASIHPYRYDRPPEGVEDEIEALRALMREFGEEKPIWVTEMGWPLRGPASSEDPGLNEWTQAKYLVRTVALLASAGVQRVYWYVLRDHRGQEGMGLLRDAEGYPERPTFSALRQLLSAVGGAVGGEREPTETGLYSVVFRRDDATEVRVIWALEPRTLALTGVESVSDLMGNAVKFDGSVVVGDAPIYVSGPVRGLPEAAGDVEVLADAARDFSGGQEERGWSYGMFIGERVNFLPMNVFRTTDFNGEWTDELRFLSITAKDQHPSVRGDHGVAAVRRWKSPDGGCVRIRGTFRNGGGGDGVRVRILVNGRVAFVRRLGLGNASVADFDLTETLESGATVDFAVDPGEAGDVGYDATRTTITILRCTNEEKPNE